MTDLIYNEINDESGTLSPCRQIVYKLFCDMMPDNTKKSIKDYITLENNYINKMLNVYSHIEDSNHNAKFSILYSLFLYLDSNGVTVDKMCRETAERISQETYLNIAYPHKELLIMEKIVMIMLNFAISNSHCKC